MFKFIMKNAQQYFQILYEMHIFQNMFYSNTVGKPKSHRSK